MYSPRADIPQTDRGDAAAATWIFCGAAAARTRLFGQDRRLPQVRREMDDKRESRKMLRLGVGAFTVVYLLTVFGAGRTPPRFLLDAVPANAPAGRVAAALLFIHVAVSYAINQQVLARSIEYALGRGELSRAKWTALSALLTLSSLIIAVLLPVFSDLVSLIGALTSAPLGFALPALCYAAATREDETKRHRVGVAVPSPRRYLFDGSRRRRGRDVDIPRVAGRDADRRSRPARAAGARGADRSSHGHGRRGRARAHRRRVEQAGPTHRGRARLLVSRASRNGARLAITQRVLAVAYWGFLNTNS